MADKRKEKISILRRKKVEERTGLKRSTMYLYIAQGVFPPPIILGPRSAGWIESEIDEWLNERVVRRDTERH